MRAPQFWWRPPGPLARTLAPVAALYGRIASRRLEQAGAWAALPTICIGNLVLGGAGKTPTALAVARRLRALGRRPVFLTRGYGGRLAGPVVVMPTLHDWRDVGDEALLLAAEAPTVVARDRVAGARVAGGIGDALVLDDGFQNPSLRKDLSVAVVDAAQGIGNGLVFPSGPLRAPLAAQVGKADAFLLIGTGPALSFSPGKPVLGAGLRVRGGDIAGGDRVFAFCGIGRPEKFFRSLEAVGAVIAGRRVFDDHHRFSDRDARDLLSSARGLGARPVTTAKDAVRLAGSPALDALRAATAVLPVEIAFSEPAAIDALLSRALARPARP